MTRFKLGAVFEHARFLNEDRTPARYRVTKVARGAVYYRPVEGGGAVFTTIERFPEKVLRWIEEAS
jgi:hypothetical protein